MFTKSKAMLISFDSVFRKCHLLKKQRVLLTFYRLMFSIWECSKIFVRKTQSQTTQTTRGGAFTAVWQTLCKLCRPIPPQAMGGPITVFGQAEKCGPAGWLTMLLIKASDVETNQGPTTTRKQVWICDICLRQMQVRKQISMRCNRNEH